MNAKPPRRYPLWTQLRCALAEHLLGLALRVIPKHVPEARVMARHVLEYFEEST